MSGDELLLAFDIGNTQIVAGVFRGHELEHHFRLSTSPDRTADEHAAQLLPLLSRAGIDPREVAGLAVACVVPPLRGVFERLGRDLFGRPALFVEPGIKTGLSIRSDNPAEVGADRIVNAVAVRELWGAPSIVVDFGTALTFDVINARGEYVGGIIAPGVGISAEALFSRASRLYRVDLQRPDELIGANTQAAMQSGLFYGWVGLVDGILTRLVESEGEPEAIVATGGQAELLAGASRLVQQVEPHLTLKGLELLHRRNR